ncbi:geranylgeranyl hydrogenase [Sulfolobales archaeon HS-7]|nr:geranylgeranyl hydrogenase [Sulfolobales archaeon HS-7]
MERVSFDVVIVGGGVAGASTAWFLSKTGLKILLIDSKPWSRIGDKPCGDAVSKGHFDELGLPYPEGEQLEQKIEGIKLYSPDMKTEWIVKGEGFEINAPAYTQRLLKESSDKGVTIMDLTTASGPIVEGNFVKGIKIFNRRENKEYEVYSKIVVDASGNARSVRTKLPSEMPIAEQLERKDADVAYREVLLSRDEISEPEYLKIFISQKASPGGYWWYFPKGKNKANVGLGIQDGMGYPNPHYYYEKYLKTYAEDLLPDKVLVKGGALVATRRPISTMAWNGILAIGDSAFTVNPVHGGGKGSAMISGYCASRAIMNAFETGNFGAEGLWDMNLCYIERYGAKQASLDLFRRFLQKLSDSDINYGMSKGLIKEDDLLEVSTYGNLHLSTADKAMRVIMGLGRPSLLVKLKIVAEYMAKAKQLYISYPKKPELLETWKASVTSLYNEFNIALEK